MDFADPLHGDRSLRDNPFLKSYFEEKDRQQQASVAHRSPIKSVHRHSFKIEKNPTRSIDPNPFIASIRRERFADQSYERDRDRSVNQLIQHRASPARDLGNKILKMAQDPFEDLWDPGRMARVLALAQEFQKDEEQRPERRIDSEQAHIKKNQMISQRAWDYATDPFGDFGSVDPNRFQQVKELANAIPLENHLIQKATGNLQTTNLKTYVAQRDFSQNESEVKNQIQKHQEKIGFIKKAGQHLELFIKKNIPRANPLHFEGVVSQQIIQAANFSQEQKIQNFENIIRGINDYVVWSSDSLLGVIPGLKHSSEEFNDKHRMKRKGEGIEDNLYYWTGMSVGFVLEGVLLKTSISGLSRGAALSQKVGNALVKAGVKTAITTKLVAGGIGEGVKLALPHAAGGFSKVAQEGAFVSHVYSAAKLKKATDAVKVIQNSPELLKKSPQLAELIRKPITDGAAFFRDLMKLSKQITHLHKFTDITAKAAVLPEIDSIVNQAMAQTVKETSETAAILEDFGGICESLDNPAKSLDAYLEFAHRQQMRQFVKDMNCPEEAVFYVMKQIPKRADCNQNSIEEIIRHVINAREIATYCDKYVKDVWIREKLIKLLWLGRKLSVLDPNVENYSDKFKEIVDHYGLDLTKHWNHVRLPRHPQVAEKYYQWVLSEVQEIHQEIQNMDISDELKRQKKFLEQFHQRIKNPLKSNPLIAAHKWYKFWKTDQLNYEIKKAQVAGEYVEFENNSITLLEIEKIHETQGGFNGFYKIHKDLQFKHFEEGGAIDDKKSLVYWDMEKVAAKTEPLIGKGIPLDGKKLGEKDFKEIIKFDEICGEAYLERSKEWVPTQFAKVHYRLNGLYHIVPFDLNSKPACDWEKYNGKD